MSDKTENLFKEIIPSVDFFSLRLVQERTDQVLVRQNILQPVSSNEDIGAMVTVLHDGGTGYAGTSDLTRSGLLEATRRAQDWAKASAEASIANFSQIQMPNIKANYANPVSQPWDSMSLEAKIAFLMEISESMALEPKIVDWSAGLTRVNTECLYLTNQDGRIEQHNQFLMPSLTVYANEGAETIRRSYNDHCHQGGLELLEDLSFASKAPQLAKEALLLLEAENCPSDNRALVLAPDQMMLQIHESIGHPLELDRILGDERNYAGTSFVTQDMFGAYQYGSELLNVSFDPTVPSELACFAADDDGLEAKKEFIIEGGVLKRPLGGTISQHRAQMGGVACTRSSSWNRPPIDRMANLNVEPGNTSFDDIIKQIESGVYMQTNLSWSIDDSRNKFQFGCEMGQLIEDGQLTKIVKKPCYRGISATFWRNLKAVGDANSGGIHGTPYCGKGEPNQIIRVGHASPTCLFDSVDIFGGE